MGIVVYFPAVAPPEASAGGGRKGRERGRARGRRDFVSRERRETDVATEGLGRL